MRPPKTPSPSRLQVIIGQNTPWTRDLRHVTAVIPRLWNKSRQTWLEPKFKDVKPKERIKWWNIVPGDSVRVLGDPDGLVQQVHAINKFSNRVFLKRQNDERLREGETPRVRNVHYSKCQLLVGRFKFPPAPGSTEPRTLPVFANRIGTSKPGFASALGRWHWERFAMGTTPSLPSWSKEAKEKIPIPWPRPRPKPKVDPTPYDTVTSAVTEITYRPPTLPLTPNAFETLAPVPSEQEYIRSLAKRSAFDPAAPVEIYVHRELTNPHSRAKKQARWQAYMLYKRSLLDQMIKEEYANLMGRTRREARAEATWKWRNRLYQEQRARKKERWVARGGEARQARRKVRKAKKAERLQRKMRELVLAPAPNQIIPGQVAA